MLDCRRSRIVELDGGFIESARIFLPACQYRMNAGHLEVGSEVGPGTGFFSGCGLPIWRRMPRRGEANFVAAGVDSFLLMPSDRRLAIP